MLRLLYIIYATFCALLPGYNLHALFHGLHIEWYESMMPLGKTFVERLL